jgi:hypothetical protein
MSYLRHLCLFAHSGIQNILCCVFDLLVFVLCPLCCRLSIFCLPHRYFLTFIVTDVHRQKFKKSFRCLTIVSMHKITGKRNRKLHTLSVLYTKMHCHTFMLRIEDLAISLKCSVCRYRCSCQI